MAVNFEKICDVGQGLSFKQDEHFTFGYITALAIGDTTLKADFKVADPLAKPQPVESKGTLGGGGADTSGILTKAVVAVLEKVTWNTEPTGMIEFEGRVTPANMQAIYSLTMQGLSKLVVQFGFVVFEYDYVHNRYYTAYATNKASKPSGQQPTGVGAIGFGSASNVVPIFGLLAKEGNSIKLTAEQKMADDPPGFRNHAFTLAVAATAASQVQQIRAQTSDTNKMIKPWGLPQQ